MFKNNTASYSNLLNNTQTAGIYFCGDVVVPSLKPSFPGKEPSDIERNETRVKAGLAFQTCRALQAAEQLQALLLLTLVLEFCALVQHLVALTA